MWKVRRSGGERGNKRRR
ncbi:hypothetical protein E2C01_067048 [Portunus trituberculatus]|uniref:Uncharacterized protein n=1 Tax=Portunus trituberculatus TaxID=210409 RepID=A0A5B7HSK9_PORTR|nr:hypothetical protein [Portunus trituberculatus]